MTHPGPLYALASVLAMVSTLCSTILHGPPVVALLLLVAALTVFAAGARIHHRSRTAPRRADTEETPR